MEGYVAILHSQWFVLTFSNGKPELPAKLLLFIVQSASGSPQGGPVLPSAFPWSTLDPSKRSGTQLEKNLTLSLLSCSLAVDRNAASEIWYVLRDLQGEPEVLGCPTVFRNSSQGGCAKGRGC